MKAMHWRSALSLSVALVLVAGLTGLMMTTSSAGPTATVSVDPRDQKASVDGSEFTIDIRVADVGNLGAFQFAIGFAPTTMQFEEFTEGPFLASTGRTTICSSVELGPGSWQFGCASGSMSNEPGPDGSGVLGTLSLTCEQPGTSALDIQDVLLADISAIEIPSSTKAGSVTCNAAAPTTTTPITTATIATVTGTPPLTDTPALTNTPPLPSAVGDVNGDEITDAIDALFILQLEADLIDTLPYPEKADTNEDGTINSVDANLILQFAAGLIPNLPP